MDRSGMARGVHGFLLLFGLSLPLLMAPQVGQGQTDVSIQQIKARLRANPADGRAYEDLGIAYHKGRRYDEAVAAFEQALALHPEYQDIPAVSPELAEASGCETVFDALGQLKGARPESLLAFREGLVSSGGIVALAVARQARPIPRLPERAASMAMASRKTLAGIWEELAATRLAQRRRIEAMEALEKSLALDSSRLSACKSLGSCYQALGFHAAAITILNRYIALAPEPDPVVTMMVSDAQRALGLAEAAQEWQRAIYLDHGFVLAHFALGNLARNAGRRTEADRHFQNALQLLNRIRYDDGLAAAAGLTAGALAESIAATLAEESLP